MLNSSADIKGNHIYIYGKIIKKDYCVKYFRVFVKLILAYLTKKLITTKL